MHVRKITIYKTLLMMTSFYGRINIGIEYYISSISALYWGNGLCAYKKKDKTFVLRTSSGGMHWFAVLKTYNFTINFDIR